MSFCGRSILKPPGPKGWKVSFQGLTFLTTVQVPTFCVFLKDQRHQSLEFGRGACVWIKTTKVELSVFGLYNQTGKNCLLLEKKGCHWVKRNSVLQHTVSISWENTLLYEILGKTYFDPFMDRCSWLLSVQAWESGILGESAGECWGCPVGSHWIVSGLQEQLERLFCQLISVSATGNKVAYQRWSHTLALHLYLQSIALSSLQQACIPVASRSGTRRVRGVWTVSKPARDWGIMDEISRYVLLSPPNLPTPTHFLSHCFSFC